MLGFGTMANGAFNHIFWSVLVGGLQAHGVDVVDLAQAVATNPLGTDYLPVAHALGQMAGEFQGTITGNLSGGIQGLVQHVKEFMEAAGQSRSLPI